MSRTPSENELIILRSQFSLMMRMFALAEQAVKNQLGQSYSIRAAITDQQIAEQVDILDGQAVDTQWLEVLSFNDRYDSQERAQAQRIVSHDCLLSNQERDFTPLQQHFISIFPERAEAEPSLLVMPKHFSDADILLRAVYSTEMVELIQRGYDSERTLYKLAGQIYTTVVNEENIQRYVKQDAAYKLLGTVSGLYNQLANLATNFETNIRVFSGLFGDLCDQAIHICNEVRADFSQDCDELVRNIELQKQLFSGLTAAEPEEQEPVAAQAAAWYMDNTLAGQLLKEEDARAVEDKHFLTGNEATQAERIEKALAYASAVTFDYKAGTIEPCAGSIEQFNDLVEQQVSAITERGTNYFYVVGNTQKQFGIDKDAQKSGEIVPTSAHLTDQIDEFFEALPQDFKQQELAVKNWIIQNLSEKFSPKLDLRVSPFHPEGKKFVSHIGPRPGLGAEIVYILSYDADTREIKVESVAKRAIYKKLDSHNPHSAGDLVDPRSLELKQTQVLKLDNSSGKLFSSRRAALQCHINEEQIRERSLDNILSFSAQDVVDKCAGYDDLADSVRGLSVGEDPLDDAAFKVAPVRGDQLRAAAYRSAAALNATLEDYLKKGPASWKDFRKPREERGINASRRRKAELLQATAKACMQQLASGELTEADAQAYLQTFHEFAAEHKSDHNSWFNRTNRFGARVQDALKKASLSPEQESAYIAKRAPRHAFSALGGLRVAAELKKVGVNELRDDDGLIKSSEATYLPGSYRNKYEDIATSHVRVGSELTSELDRKLKELVNSKLDQIKSNYDTLFQLLDDVSDNPVFEISKSRAWQYRDQVSAFLEPDYTHQEVIAKQPFGENATLKDQAIRDAVRTFIPINGAKEFDRYRLAYGIGNNGSLEQDNKILLAEAINKFIKNNPSFTANFDQIIKWVAQMRMSRTGLYIIQNGLYASGAMTTPLFNGNKMPPAQEKIVWNAQSKAFEYHCNEDLRVLDEDGEPSCYSIKASSVVTLAANDSGGLVSSIKTYVDHDVPGHFLASRPILDKLVSKGGFSEVVTTERPDDELYLKGVFSIKEHLQLDVLLDKMQAAAITDDDAFNGLVLEFHTKFQEQKALLTPEKIQQVNTKLFDRLVDHRTYLLKSMGEASDQESFARVNSKLVALQMLSRGVMAPSQQDDFIHHINDSVRLYCFVEKLGKKLKSEMGDVVEANKTVSHKQLERSMRGIKDTLMSGKSIDLDILITELEGTYQRAKSEQSPERIGEEGARPSSPASDNGEGAAATTPPPPGRSRSSSPAVAGMYGTRVPGSPSRKAEGGNKDAANKEEVSRSYPAPFPIGNDGQG